VYAQLPGQDPGLLLLIDPPAVPSYWMPSYEALIAT